MVELLLSPALCKRYSVINCSGSDAGRNDPYALVLANWQARYSRVLRFDMGPKLISFLAIVLALICFVVLGAFAGCTVGVLDAGYYNIKLNMWIIGGGGVGGLIAVIWIYLRHRAGKRLW